MRVAAILSAAERDARAVVEAARREAYESRQDRGALDGLPAAPEHHAGGAPGLAALAGVTGALEALGRRVSAVERTIDARFELLWRAIAARDGDGASAPTPAPVGDLAARAERLRAVDLALRGFSRAQIAAELRSTMGEAEIERLLDSVLEPA